ncbi:RAB6A-GEF complex partner protein 2 [Neolecta irregularis DAH-3]|uniref:RAB6A-GEF complex partner protein 2 n=1 Tax=Neolecta irregularis (strain DAH-3) TaxID=1198029 RepID=A0A1U7LNH7_NEOID|nr:RAB6A-GEF complex partner protein 2 [Neolecta irregularis DAH-3]|eukprot:OLL24204.1 RAB6A-GEF complex partner protein 2 [Neolecta irregularis DAH-3]
MSNTTPSPICVQVNFQKSAFFAGERFSCEVTFKNTAQCPVQTAESTPIFDVPFSPKKTVRRSTQPSISAKEVKPLLFHKQSDSTASDKGVQFRRESRPLKSQRSGSQRSLSIVSITQPPGEAPLRSAPINGHERTASLTQTHSRNWSSGIVNGPSSARPFHLGRSPSYHTNGIAPLTQPPTPRHAHSNSGLNSFRFPAHRTPSPNGPHTESPFPLPQSATVSNTSQSPINTTRPIENDKPSENRILHTTKPDPPDQETPRSSVEFYALTNTTNETLISTYTTNFTSRKSFYQRFPSLSNGSLSRRQSIGFLSLSSRPRGPEMLMMGYVRLEGSFVVDEALVQTRPFDEIKKQAVIGNQTGGGVIGVEMFRERPAAGLLNGFSGWFGGSKLSTLDEMQDRAHTKEVPVLSTPPTILFVDLRLAPGESRTFTFNTVLPMEIPSSHRGKALKITYNLNIASQRVRSDSQTPTLVKIPIKIYSRVDAQGRIFTYNLRKPVVRQRDDSKIIDIDTTDQTIWKRPDGLIKIVPQTSKRVERVSDADQEDFLQYVGELLSNQPSSPRRTRRNLSFSNAQTMGKANKTLLCSDAIEHAIRGGYSGGGSFDIGKMGKRIAILMINRPAYTLGQTIVGIIDFSKSLLKNMRVKITLESSESVSQELAVRSEASVYRATRKVHVEHIAGTTNTERETFSFGIPLNASPTMSTSGVSHSWHLCLEFVTANEIKPGEDDENSGSIHGSDISERAFLTQSLHDNRGRIFVPVVSLDSSSFDCKIPIQIFPPSQDAGTEGEVRSLIHTI